MSRTTIAGAASELFALLADTHGNPVASLDAAGCKKVYPYEPTASGVAKHGAMTIFFAGWTPTDWRFTVRYYVSGDVAETIVQDRMIAIIAAADDLMASGGAFGPSQGEVGWSDDLQCWLALSEVMVGREDGFSSSYSAGDNVRILMVAPGPNFSVADVHRGWSAALAQAGCEVMEANFAARLEWYERACKSMGQTSEEAVYLACESLRATCSDFWPDVVVITSSFYVNDFTLDLFRHHKHKVVLLHTESPYEDDRQLQRAQHADLNILNDPTNIDHYPDGTLYLPHCYDPDIHHPGPSSVAHDFAMVGTGYPSRIEFLESVDWPCKPVLCGNWQAVADDSPLIPFLAHDRGECFPNEDAADLYRGSKSSLNLYRKEAQHADLIEGWAMGPREVELAACGTFYLTEERGENREVLPMIPTVDSPEDFSEKLAWWLDHDTERERVASQAQATVADRTFDNNARELLKLIG